MIEKAKSNPTAKQKLIIGKVSNRLKEKAIVKGFDLSDFNYDIDVSGTRHAFKEHGTEKTEIPRGQIRITDDDFHNIPEVIYNYDEVSFTGKNKTGLETITYKKSMPDNTIYYVEEITKTLEENNIKVLHNTNKKLIIDGNPVFIAGIQYKPENMHQISKSLDNTQKPTIMLTHSPDEFKKIPQDYVNLILAGHTHGGQIRIPFLGPLFTASSYGDKYAKGFIKEDGKIMITTTGIGTSILPIRFNCSPEIVVIEFE